MTHTATPNIAMIILMQNDLEKAIEFYTALGFTLNFHIPQQWAEFSDGTIKLGLAWTNTELPERRTGIVLEIDDLREWAEHMKASHGIICNDLTEQLHGIMASITDPGNNILELYQPTPEKMQQAIDRP
jgi:predicted enzyme related to lactoylglutathione lyase